MADGTRVIVRTLNGPAGKDGEVTLARLATELEPYAEDTDLAELAGETQNVHGIPDTSQLVKYTDLGALWNRGEFGQFGLVLAETTDAAHARAELGITVDTTVGTRVFVGGVMVYGDTGWRRLDGPSAEYTTRVRRVGALVEVASSWTSETPEEGVVVLAASPLGFRPPQTLRFLWSEFGSEPNKLAAVAPNVITVRPKTAFQSGSFNAFWSTPEAWPTTLPGTPV